MAGEWIKVRTNLWDDTRVSGLCDHTKQPEAMVIGGLYWLWSTADEHTEDGLCNGLSVTAIDRKTGIPGLGAALVAIGWVEDTPLGVRMVRFDEHNGASAKARAVTAKRVAKHRSQNEDASVVPGYFDSGNGDSVTGPLAREDKNKRREDSKPPHKEAVEGAARKSATGTRLPEDWKPSAVDLEYCKTERPDLLPSLVATNFYEYWSSKSGKDATKTRWDLTWRTWVRKENVASAGRQLRAGTVAQVPIGTSIAEQNAENSSKAKQLLFGNKADDKFESGEGMVIDHA